MKRTVLFFFLLLFISVMSENVSAQSTPLEAFRNFWSKAPSNSYKSAQNFVFSDPQTKESKYKQIQDSFQVISQHKLQFPELNDSQIFPESAYFTFQIESENKKKFKGQVLLINQNRGWRILLFDVNPVVEQQTPSEFKNPPFRNPPIFTPLRDFPVTRKCSICS